MEIPAKPNVDLVGVYCYEKELREAMAEMDTTIFLPPFLRNEHHRRSFVDHIVQMNPAPVLVELDVSGAACWYKLCQMAGEPPYRTSSFEFEPFEIRQPSTRDEDRHLLDYAFLDSSGMHHFNSCTQIQNLPDGTSDFRVTMFLRKFDEHSPILTPTRTFELFEVTNLPVRLSRLVAMTPIGLD